MKRRIAIFIAVVLVGAFLAPGLSRVVARGSQFKGILPPGRVRVEEKVIETATPAPENIYPDLYMVVNIPARKVMLYDGGKEVARHTIAIGQPYYKTPAGPQSIDTIIWNPWWIPPDSPWARGSSRTPPGPKNPLGPVKMLMGQGVRLHGNNSPSSIGRAASHGCLRMNNDEAASLAWYIQKRINNSEDDLFEKYRKNRRSSYWVRLNVPVRVDITYEPVEIRDNTLHVYYDIYGWGGNLKTEIINSLIKHGIDLNKIDADRLAQLKYPSHQNKVLKIRLQDIFSETPIMNACYEEGM